MTDQLMMPPHSIEAEQSVLGGLMLDNQAFDKIADLITEKDFFNSGYALIFEKIAQSVSSMQQFDVVTLSELMERDGSLQRVGGMTALGGLAKNTPGAANIVRYAEIVRENAILRNLASACGDIQDLIFGKSGLSQIEIVDNAERLILDIASKGGVVEDTFEDMNELLQKAVDRLDVLTQSSSSITGLPTGFTDLDEMTAGLQPGDLIIVAGRPSMGKTAFSVNIAEHAAMKQGVPAAIFSMEMNGTQLVNRMLSSVGRIGQQKIRTGKLDDTDWPRLTSAIGCMGEASIFIDSSPALSPADIRARLRRLLRRTDGKLGLVIVDYIQLMRPTQTSHSNRTSEITEISRSLKAIALEFDVPMIALSQLNRSLESRPNKRPVMSDLRESGSIEQDADVIMFIYRDEVYNEDSTDRGLAEINISKQRNGPTGMKKLTFIGEHTRFENYMPEPFPHMVASGY